jgi:hypothetical protein
MLKSVAAAGLVGTGLTGTASATDWHELTLCATGSETFSYHVEVSHGAKRGGTHQSDDGDHVSDVSVRGAASEERCDSFLFKGEITDYELDGPGKVLVDGKVVEDTSKDGHDDKDDEEREVTFCAAEDGKLSYRVEVSGEMMRGGTHQSDDGDEVGDDYADGAAAEGRCDSFRWTGEVESLKLDGHGVVKVDGKVIRDTRDEDGGDGELDKVVVVSSPGTDEQMNYVLEVTGGLEKLEPNEDGGAAVDNVSESGGRIRVEGTVGSGDDKFAFSGDLIEIDVPDGVQIAVRNR